MNKDPLCFFLLNRIICRHAYPYVYFFFFLLISADQIGVSPYYKSPSTLLNVGKHFIVWNEIIVWLELLKIAILLRNITNSPLIVIHYKISLQHHCVTSASSYRILISYKIQIRFLSNYSAREVTLPHNYLIHFEQKPFNISVTAMQQLLRLLRRARISDFLCRMQNRFFSLHRCASWSKRQDMRYQFSLSFSHFYFYYS